MADIRQELGIDVSQAVRALDTLDRRFEQFGGSLDRVGAKLRSFNSLAQRAFRLGNITGDLESAATATQKVVKGFAGFAGAAQSAGTAGQAAAAGLNSTATAAQNASSAATTLGVNATNGTTRAATAFQRLTLAATTTASRVRASLSTLGRNFQAFGQNASNSLGGFTLSFQTLARIVSTQAIIRGIGAISGAFRQAVSDAIAFQNSISEIQTIASGAFRNFDSAADAVRRVSDAFNLPLGDAAEGLYDVISQQIQGAANQVNVLEQSAVLARVGIASLDESVELITGTLNAFELSAGQAERVAAIMFRTVDLGNTRVSELVNSFGQVSTLANEVGVSLEELAAAFAVVTINGVNTAKASTQIRGVLNALLKPTVALKTALEEAGFAEGAVAVQTLGLGGALNLISDAADGSQAKLSALIPRLRGITAQLILARNGGALFEQQLDRINETATAGLQEEFELRINTDAEQVTRTINQLSNALTVDLGQSVLKVIAFFTRFSTVNQTATRVIQILTPAIVLATGALGLYALAAGAAALANTKFAASGLAALGVLRGFPLAIAAAAAIGIGVFVATQAASAATAQRIVDDTRRSNAERIKGARETRQALLQIEIQGITDRTLQSTNFVRTERIALNDRLKTWKDTSDKIKTATETLYSDIVDANREFVNTLKRNAEDAAQSQINSQQRVADLRQGLEDAAFRSSLSGRDPVAQAFLQQERAANLARTASEQLAAAVRSEQVDSAVSQTERARTLADEAVQTAKTSGNRAAVSRALANQRDVIQQIIQAELAQQQVQKQREADSRRAAANEEARIRNLETEISKVLNLQKDFDPSASPIERETILKEVEAAFKQIGKLSVPDGSKLTADQLIDLAKLRSDVQNAFKVSEAQGIDINATLSGDSLRTLSQEITSVAETAFSEGIRRAINRGTLGAEQLSQLQDAARTQGPVAALDSLVNALNAERDRLIQVERNEESIVRASENLKEAGEVVAKTLDRGNTALQATSKALQAIPGAISDGIGKLTGQTRLSVPEGLSELSRIEQQVRNLPERAQFLPAEQLQGELDALNKQFAQTVDNLGLAASLSLGPNIRRLNEAVQAADEAIQKEVSTGAAVRENIQRALEGLNATGQDAAANMGNAASAGSDLDTALNTSSSAAASIARSAQIAAQGFREAATASNSIGTGGSGGQTQNAAFGGLIRYFNNGGFTPRGTDTVPAMLSPGEFVVNAKSTKRFFSQLQAINSGVQPRFFQDGGAVTNVGDINVTVSDSRGGDATGRDIARSLKRELRRNTSSFR